MKKILTVILLALPVILNAQNIGYGVKCGVNISSYRGENDGSLYRGDAYAGLFANYQFNKNTGIQTELLYSRQGSRDTLNDNKINTSLNYLSMPVLFQIRLTNYNQFSIFIGPQLSYLLHAKVKTGDDTSTQKSLFKKLDYGAIIGAEYELSDQFLINARYYFGLTEFNNQEITKSEAKNSNLSIGAAFRF